MLSRLPPSKQVTLKSRSSGWQQKKTRSTRIRVDFTGWSKEKSLQLAGPFGFGFRFVLDLQPFPHCDAAENRIEDKPAHGAAFQFGGAANPFGFLFGTADEKCGFLVAWHGHLPSL
jgi:hypothetical protein